MEDLHPSMMEDITQQGQHIPDVILSSPALCLLSFNFICVFIYWVMILLSNPCWSPFKPTIFLVPLLECWDYWFVSHLSWVSASFSSYSLGSSFNKHKAFSQIKTLGLRRKHELWSPTWSFFPILGCMCHKIRTICKKRTPIGFHLLSQRQILDKEFNFSWILPSPNIHKWCGSFLSFLS